MIISVFFIQDRCIKVVDTAADKSGAESTCGSGGSPFSGPGKLFAPKSRSEQQDLEQFLKRKSVTDEIYLGMTKNGDGQVCLLTQYIFFTSREAAWSCRTAVKKEKGNLWILVHCSFIICLVVNIFENNGFC